MWQQDQLFISGPQWKGKVMKVRHYICKKWQSFCIYFIISAPITENSPDMWMAIRKEKYIWEAEGCYSIEYHVVMSITAWQLDLQKVNPSLKQKNLKEVITIDMPGCPCIHLMLCLGIKNITIGLQKRKNDRNKTEVRERLIYCIL